jgi:hypothetical protein
VHHPLPISWLRLISQFIAPTYIDPRTGLTTSSMAERLLFRSYPLYRQILLHLPLPHSFMRKFIHIEMLYGTFNLIFSWFVRGNYYIAFSILSNALEHPEFYIGKLDQRFEYDPQIFLFEIAGDVFLDFVE